MNWSSPGINAKVEHFVGRTWVVRVLPSHGRVDSPFCALTSAELCNKESGSIHIAENAQEKGGKGRPGPGQSSRESPGVSHSTLSHLVAIKLSCDEHSIQASVSCQHFSHFMLNVDKVI